MTTRRTWYRDRSAFAIAQQTRLQRCATFADAEVRYFWTEDDVPTDGSASWTGPGYYWRPFESYRWTFIGPGKFSARRTVTAKLRGQGALLRPPSLDQVIDVVTTVAGVASALLPLAGDVRDLVRGDG